jgi:hypothetical protein
VPRLTWTPATPPRCPHGRRGGVAVWRYGRWATLGLCLLAAAAYGDAAIAQPGTSPPAFLAEPLWNGQFVRGGTSELRVGLHSDTGGDARVRLDSGRFVVTTTVSLTAGRTRDLALPLRPAAQGRVEVSAELPDGSQHRKELMLRSNHGDALLRVHASAVRGDAEPMTVAATPADLPRTAAGYGPVGTLWLTAADLAALDPEQVTALSQYLGACRPFYLTGATHAQIESIRKASGCDGRGVHAATDATPIPGQEWANGPTPGMGMMPTAVDGSDERGRAALLLLPYGVLLLALLAARPGPWVIVVPGAAAVLVWLALPRVLAPADSVTWIEWDAGAPVARFTTRLETHGQGRPSAPVLLPPHAALPAALDGGPTALVLTDSGMELTGARGLFQQRRFSTHGVAPPPLDIAFEYTDQGYIISNPGDPILAGGWLIEAGCARSLGGIPAGESRWEARISASAPSPCAVMPSPLVPPAETAAALLLDLDPNRWSMRLAGAPGPVWLLIRPARGDH